MKIANEGDEPQASGILMMIHCDHLDVNYNDNEQWVEGTPRFLARSLDRFNDKMNPTTYSRGGDAVNVVLTNEANSNLEWTTVMRCDYTTCQECFPETATPGPGKGRGLPFVHASNLQTGAPPISTPTNADVLIFREGTQEPPSDLVVTSSVKKLVKYDHPIGNGAFIAVETAVCIFEDCRFCNPNLDGDTTMEEAEDLSRPAGTGPNGDGFLIRGIIDSRKVKGYPHSQYLIWWKGYRMDEATWEPTEAAAGGDHIFLRNFYEDNPEKPRPSLARATKAGIEHLLNRP